MYTRDRPFHAPRRKPPSFSSSLLESIYRSIDESEGQDECFSFYGEGFAGATSVSARKQSVRGGYDRNSSSAPCSAGRRGFTSLERVIMIEEWMEKQGSRSRCGSSSINSGSSSSGSSSGGRLGACSFSSSDTEPGRRRHRSQHRLPTQDVDGSREKTKKKGGNDDLGGGGISRTKLGALKIYGELKKVKQPISPGGKISAFLNSIFNSGNVKKAKMCYVGVADDVSSFDHKATTLSSSVSSYAKPCMSKTPSARKLSADNGNTKRSQRSVRFYPSEVDPGGNNPEQFGYRTVLRSCPSYKEKDFATNTKDWLGGDHVHEDEGYDGLSCSSSDLFELGDHLIGRFGEELPVYETTSFKRNQAIAHGFIF